MGSRQRVGHRFCLSQVADGHRTQASQPVVGWNPQIPFAYGFDNLDVSLFSNIVTLRSTLLRRFAASPSISFPLRLSSEDSTLHMFCWKRHLDSLAVQSVGEIELDFLAEDFWHC